MPEVPGSQYEPYFTAQPTERPIQLRGVDAPGAAFGENIGNAIRTFGGDVEAGSKEVFDRAMALRKLQIEGQLRDLTTQAYNETAPLNEDFLTKKGDLANQDALNAHLANQDQIRKKYEDQARAIGGDYGVNVFGNEFASMQRNQIIKATGHSVTETKQSYVNGAKAQLDIIRQSWGRFDQPEYDQKVKDGRALIRETGIHEGESESMILDAQSLFERQLRVDQILGLSWDNPKAGMFLLEMHKGELGDKYNDVRKQVENRYKEIEGDKLSDHAAEQIRKTDGSVQDGVDAVRKTVTSDPVASQIPGMETHTTNQLRAKIRGQNYDAQQDVNRAQQELLNMINAPGANFRTLAELEASSPRVKDLEDQLRQTKQGALVLNGLNGLIQHDWTVAHTRQMDANYEYLRGLATSTDPVRKQEFLEKSTDLSKFELRKSDWNALMSKRDQIIKNPEQENPIFKRAMRIAQIGANGDILKELGINKLTDSNSVKYHRMTGAMSIAIDEWMKANDGKAPSDKELDEQIIKPTIREHFESPTMAHWFGRRRGAFDIDVDKDTLKELKDQEAERMSKYGQSVTSDQITDEEAVGAAQRLYFHKLYAKPEGPK